MFPVISHLCPSVLDAFKEESRANVPHERLSGKLLRGVELVEDETVDLVYELNQERAQRRAECSLSRKILEY